MPLAKSCHGVIIGRLLLHHFLYLLGVGRRILSPIHVHRVLHRGRCESWSARAIYPKWNQSCLGPAHRNLADESEFVEVHVSPANVQSYNEKHKKDVPTLHQLKLRCVLCPSFLIAQDCVTVFQVVQLCREQLLLPSARFGKKATSLHPPKPEGCGGSAQNCSTGSLVARFKVKGHALQRGVQG